MGARVEHAWDLAPAEARAVQEKLRSRVILKDRRGPVRRIAGCDVGFEDGRRTARGAVAVLSADSLDLLASAVRRRPVSFPYVPGLLSFREVPVLLDALGALDTPPDLILCDGQGIAHPRRFGLACHLGVLTDIPTIGVAKTRLVGEHQEPGPRKGDWSPLMDGREMIGGVLRTRAGTRPLYVSSGHRITLRTALRRVMDCVTRFRLPETTRWADRLASG
jgi:deoxyribonuclease V